MKLNINTTLERLRYYLEHWPAGMIVWHKATGSRGVIIEHVVNDQGSVCLCVSFDPLASERGCQPCELSEVALPDDDDDGDRWKHKSA